MSEEHTLELPETRLSRLVDGALLRLDGIVSWLWLLLVAVIVLNVVMRYIFSEGRIEFEEIQWHLYAAGFLLGLSSAYVTDSHVRVDVLRMRLPVQAQAWLELYGIILLLLPFVILVLVAAWPFVAYSFETAEISEAPGGLPFRWFIKSLLVTGFVLLLVATLSRLSRVLAFLFGWPSEAGETA